MATFNINIDAEPNIPYIPQGLKIRRSNCAPVTETISLGIVETTETPSLEFIFKDYTGIGWDTLRIYDVEYSNQAGFYVEYSGSKLLPNVDPNVAVATIDVSTVNANESVPTFQLELDNIALTQNEFLKFTVEVEDTATNLGGKVDVYFYILVEECAPTTPIKVIGTVSETINSCTSLVEVTVRVPAEGSRYVYSTISDGFGFVSGTLPETIYTDTTYTIDIEGNNGGSTNPIYSTVLLGVKASVSDSIILASKRVTRIHSGDIC